MKRAWERPNVKIHPSFIGYAAILGMLDGPAIVCGFLLALITHEAGHLFAGMLLHEPFERVELTPFGGVITYQTGKSACKGAKGVLIASAGPIGNYAMIALLSRLPAMQGFLYDVQRSAIIVNASMLLVNLLPVLPLDGGRIVFSVGYYLFPVTALLAVLGALGAIAGALLILLAAYGLATLGTLNVSLLIVGCYIAVCAQKDRQSLLVHEFYTILNERMNRKKRVLPIRLYAVSGEADLFSLVPALCRPGEYVCAVDRERQRRIVGEEELIRALFAAPHQPFGGLFDQRHQTSDETI